VEPVLVHAGKAPVEAIEVDVPVVDLSGQCSATALAETVQRLAREADGRAVVLLEYSGYGYATRGAPLWLARGLRKACREDGLSLLTIFHELYATGPPWSSAFWISGAQRFVAAFLARISSSVLANRTGTAEWVRRYAPSAVSVETRPVFSNVGEPGREVLGHERAPRAVVFGGGRKEKVYGGRFSELCSLLAGERITHIVDIGPSTPVPKRVGGIEVDKRGILPKEEVSRLLSSAQIGLLQCPLDHLTKSGVMAAYFAHGVAPIVVEAQASTDVLVQGAHFLTVGGLHRRVNRGRHAESLFRSVGRAGLVWYEEQAHSKNTAQTIVSLVQQVM
jgi:hypothetical protein